MSARIKDIFLINCSEDMLHNVFCQQDLEASLDYLKDVKKRETKPQKGFAGMVDYEPAEYSYMSYKHFLTQFLEQKKKGILVASALKYEFNYNLNLDELPKNSQDAISYGYLKLLYNEVISYDLDIILIGGDAKKLKYIFTDAKIDNELIFNSMKKIVREI